MLVMETDSGAKTDTNLLAEFAASGAPEVFAELVRRNADMVYAACRRVLNDTSAAEDAAQATFLVLYRKARGLPSGTLLASWLYRVAEFSACEMRRARERRARHEEEAMSRRREDAPVTDRWEDVRPHLDSAMAALPGKLREVMVLHYMRGLPMSEVAQALGCSEGAIKMRISRGLHRLREKLRRAGVFVPSVALTAFLSERAVEAAPRELAAGITKACLAKAVRPAAGAVAKTVAAKLFWTPLKITVLATGLAFAVLLPTAYLALRRGAATETAPSPETLPVSTVPAAQAAAPQEQDNDGLHLDDTRLWRLTAEHPMRRFPMRVEVPFTRPEKQFWNFGLLHERSWVLGAQAVSLRAAFCYTPHAPRWASFKLLAALGPHLEWSADRDPALILLCNQGNETVGSYRRNIGTVGSETLDQRSFSPGRHVLELAVSNLEWVTQMDGRLLYRGPHGFTGESVKFAVGLVTGPDPEVTLTLDNVRVGPSGLLDAKPPEEF